MKHISLFAIYNTSNLISRMSRVKDLPKSIQPGLLPTHSASVLFYRLVFLSLLVIGFFLFTKSTYAQETCSFVEADCSWDAVSGASSYNVKITEVETNTVVKNVPVAGNLTKYTFPVNQGKTYRCEVSAVNSCGQSGPAGTAEAFCPIQGLVSAAPSPTPPPKTPTPTPTPTPLPSPSPSPSPKACGMPCTTSSECKTGFVCLKMPTGQGYCANPEYQQYCIEKPTVKTCCEAPPKPTPPPELPKTGLLDNTITIAVVGVILVGIATVLLIL